MTIPKNRLADLTQPVQGPYRIRQVLAVHSDNTVTVDWGIDEDGHQVTVTVPCESGYTTRAPGDVVRVIVDDAIGWSVTGKVNAAALIVSQLMIVSSN